MTAWTADSRHESQRVRLGLLVATAALLSAVVAVSSWRFVSPPDSVYALAEVRLAPVSAFALGSVTGYRVNAEGEVARLLDSRSDQATSVVNGRGFRSGVGLFYVVRLPNGDAIVFSGRSTHLRHAVVWDQQGDLQPRGGMFVEPGHGERWAIDGTRVSGPAPRDLDRYESHVDERGMLVIDLGTVIRSDYETSGGPVPPYDVNDPDWPTSGWPDVETN
jgi:Rieske Fe-S protein